MKKFLLTLPFIAGCSSVKKQASPFGNRMSLDEAASPVDVPLGAGDKLGYETYLELSFFDPTNLMLWLCLCSIAGYFVWKEFRRVRPKSS